MGTRTVLLRFSLNQEEEKRRNADMLYEKIREQLRRKEEQYRKEVEVKQQLELSLQTLEMELRTVKSNLNQVVQERNDTQRQLSRTECQNVTRWNSDQSPFQTKGD